MCRFLVVSALSLLALLALRLPRYFREGKYRMICHMLSAILLLSMTAGYLAAVLAYWEAGGDDGSSSFAGSFLVLGILFVTPGNLLLYLLFRHEKTDLSDVKER